MRNLVIILCSIVTMSACDNENKQNAVSGNDKDKPTSTSKNSTKSIPSESSKWIGNTAIRINYYSPAVRGRVIWGGLVAYDSVWVTGAHQATSFEIGKDFLIGDKSIAAGKYAFFTIPGRQDWTIIFNRNWKQHLADDYQQSEDIFRINVKPEIVNENAERLKYEIDQTGERTANIIISWEKLRISFPITIK